MLEDDDTRSPLIERAFEFLLREIVAANVNRFIPVLQSAYRLTIPRGEWVMTEKKLAYYQTEQRRMFCPSPTSMYWKRRREEADVDRRMARSAKRALRCSGPVSRPSIRNANYSAPRECHTTGPKTCGCHDRQRTVRYAHAASNLRRYSCRFFVHRHMVLNAYSDGRAAHSEETPARLAKDLTGAAPHRN